MNAQDLAQQLHGKLVTKMKRELVMSEDEKIIQDLTLQLYEAMADENIDHVAIKDEASGEVIKYEGYIDQDFSLVKETAGTDKWDDFPAWFEWLRAQGLGDAIKVKETVHAATRKKLIKEQMGQGVVLPEWMKERFFNTVKSNGAALKRIAAKALEGGNNG